MASRSPFGGGLSISRRPQRRQSVDRSGRVSDDGSQGTIELTDDRSGSLSRQQSRSSSVSAQRRSNRSLRFNDFSAVAPHFRPNHHNARRHGNETFGEALLHPIKEFEAHRHHAHGTHDEKQQHTDSLEAGAMDSQEKKLPVVRTFIHFRHLMGDQNIRITKATVDQLEKPLQLTEQEVLKLYSIHDTDELVEFFHKSKREYSLKIHKAIKKPSKIKEKSESTDAVTANDGVDQSECNTPVESSDYPGSTIVFLNDNVFLELKPLEVEEEKEHKLSRRAIFEIPDPDLSDEIGEETSATWLELFGDVFYVGILATFTHEHHIVNQQQLGIYASWFVVIWWTWCASALYSSRYDRSDVMHHFYKVIELCGLVGMAGASNAFWDEPQGFIIGYLVMKAVLLIEYSVVLWAAIVSGSFSRKPLGAYVAVHALALILWGVSLVFPDNRAARFSLWYVSIFLELIVHMWSMSNKHVSLAASHLAERFALFTIIVLGENCMGFVRAVMEMGTEVRIVVANMFGLVIIFLFFFMYFDDFSKEVLAEVDMSQIWMYLHFPLHLCQVAFGIALTDTISIYNSGITSHVTEHMSSLKNALMVAAVTAAEGSEEGTVASVGEGVTAGAGEGESAELHADPSYVFKSFWVAGGLIIFINMLIKLVNTPVSGAKWSYVICVSRLLNAIVFWALVAVPVGNLSGLAMLAIMASCLLFQAAVDLLD